MEYRIAPGAERSAPTVVVRTTRVDLRKEEPREEMNHVKCYMDEFDQWDEVNA